GAARRSRRDWRCGEDGSPPGRGVAGEKSPAPDPGRSVPPPRSRPRGPPIADTGGLGLEGPEVFTAVGLLGRAARQRPLHPRLSLPVGRRRFDATTRRRRLPEAPRIRVSDLGALQPLYPRLLRRAFEPMSADQLERASCT